MLGQNTIRSSKISSKERVCSLQKPCFSASYSPFAYINSFLTAIKCVNDALGVDFSQQ